MICLINLKKGMDNTSGTGDLSIEVEWADPSRIMTYSEADPEADMQNVIFYLNPKCYPKRVSYGKN